jgi:arylsulfatase A-like enzyme
MFVFPGGAVGGDRGRVRNIILIVVDTLAAQNLGFMDYDRNTCPFLDKFANESIVFENAYTPKAETLPSFASLFTGLHPANHKVLENGMTVPENVHSLVEDFRDAGFATWGVPAFRVIGPQYGINRGFEYYGNAPPDPLPASRVIERVRRILEGEPQLGEPSLKDTDNRILLFIHFYDTHTEYTPDPEILASFAEPYYDGPVDGTWEQFNRYNHREIKYNQSDLRRITDLYDAEIGTLDDRLAELFEIFKRTGLWDNSIIVFTADHGENLGEHHYLTHGPPYEKALHIPLVIHFPGGKFGGRRMEALVENTDVMPTLMSLCRVHTDSGTDGSSFLPLLFGETPESDISRDYLFACGACDDNSGRALSIFDGRYRLTMNLDWSAEPVLYDVRKDPHEDRDITGENPEQSIRLQRLLFEIADERLSCEPTEMDPETVRMLQSIGYLH